MGVADLGKMQGNCKAVLAQDLLGRGCTCKTAHFKCNNINSYLPGVIVSSGTTKSLKLYVGAAVGGAVSVDIKGVGLETANSELVVAATGAFFTGVVEIFAR